MMLHILIQRRAVSGTIQRRKRQRFVGRSFRAWSSDNLFSHAALELHLQAHDAANARRLPKFEVQRPTYNPDFMKTVMFNQGQQLCIWRIGALPGEWR